MELLMPKLFENLTPDALLDLKWNDFEPHYADLVKEPLGENTIADWMARWTTLSEIQEELYNRAYVATSINTADKTAENRFDEYMQEIYPNLAASEQKLKKKLLASGLSVEGFEIPLRNMHAEAELFREDNIPLRIEEEKLSNTFDKVTGAQSVQWDGEEKTVRQMEILLRDKDANTRLAGWEAMSKRQLDDRGAINDLWSQFMEIREKVAKNAGLHSFRDFRWREMLRFDYSPEDCKSFHNAIEEAVVPVVNRLAERRKKELGLDALRYCDIFVDLTDQEPLKPFSNVDELKKGVTSIFEKVHPRFATYFKQLDEEGLLDLENRKNKANGAYCTEYAYIKRPFIFANAVGIHDDVQTVLHEGGHSFHSFECFGLPYFQQRAVPIEFAEVASMGMEFLSIRYVSKKNGGFYTDAEAARALAEHLEQSLMFWPYMAIVDAFQHWVYENPAEGKNPTACDSKWAELEDRFRPYINWTGYEDVKMTGWHRKPHIHQIPFYYVEYGLAQLGAAQIWKNALENETKAVDSYLKALSLGGTVTLPVLFETAGAKFSFDATTLRQAAEQMERTIVALG
jgi:oligoendopeptidase F